VSPAPIRRPRSDELEALVAIEREAGALFAAIGMPEIAHDDAGSPAELEPFRAGGRAWVAVDADDRPIAYLISAVVDGCAHIEQVSVVPAHARRGLGAALIDHLAAVAAAEDRPALSLTTFRDVPWNAPYYERLGFRVVAAADQGPELAALVAEEAERIPGEAPRVAMRRAVQRSPRALGAGAASAARTSGSELPETFAQQRHRRAAGLDAIDLDLG
jgi:GNAT superfamily N-acetyltransferase